MDLEWDPEKALINLKKHGIDFADVEEVLQDTRALTWSDPDSQESRMVTIGRDALSRLLVVVYAWRCERIRIVSARKATRRERRQYEERR